MMREPNRTSLTSDAVLLLTWGIGLLVRRKRQSSGARRDTCFDRAPAAATEHQPGLLVSVAAATRGRRVGPADLRPVAPRQRILMRSTTKTRVSSGPIARPAPRLPYASIGGIVIRRRPPTLIPATP